MVEPSVTFGPIISQNDICNFIEASFMRAYLAVRHSAIDSLVALASAPMTAVLLAAVLLAQAC
jgi:hypothetical protein